MSTQVSKSESIHIPTLILVLEVGGVTSYGGTEKMMVLVKTRRRRNVALLVAEMKRSCVMICLRALEDLILYLIIRHFSKVCVGF